MNFLPCGLSKDKLKELTDILKKGDIMDFIKFEKARDILFKMAYPDQPNESNTHRLPAAEPNAIKYFDILKSCEELLNTADPSTNEIDEFADRLRPELRKKLKEKDADRTEVLKDIRIEYSASLIEQDLYEKLVRNITEAQEKKTVKP